jgi:MoaA/NifB/PqqE/SkfB family radical SAM enzyme
MKSFLKSKFNQKCPLEVTYIITGRCNLLCKYCKYSINKKELSTEEAKKAIREFSDAGTLVWTFTGGETLLRRDIGELINYAKDCGILFVHLLTNGVLFKSKIEEIKNLDLVTFSLDGPIEIHDELRGNGSFQKIMEAIDAAKEKEINFSLTTIVTRLNMANNFYGIKYVFNLAKNLGCRVNFQPVLFINNKPDDFYPSKEERISILEFLKKLSINSNFLKYSEHTYNVMLKIINNEEINLDCLAGKKFCFLHSDGKVVSSFDTRECIDGIKIGFLEAFYQLKHKHSQDCFIYCLPEKNVLYRFNLYSLIKYIPIIIKEKIAF